MVKARELRTVPTQEQISLLRRSIFAFSTTFACFALVIAVLWLNPEGSLGEKIVGACMSYAELMAMLYLSASVVDRTKLVDRVSERFTGPARSSAPEDDERGTQRFGHGWH